MQVQDWMAERGAEFEVIAHEQAYSSQRLAQVMHVRGDLVAKTVLLHVDDHFVVAVIPATHRIHIDLVAEALHAHLVELATERQLAEHFPDCEWGALLPFGSQYGLQTVVDYTLTEDEEIVFEANDHRRAIRMKYQDFAHLERPDVAVLSYHCYP